jgi:hypothetical protein
MDVIPSTATNSACRTGFLQDLDTYFKSHPKPPTLTEWLNAHMSAEQQEYYALLMRERLTATEPFPVHFDPLWDSLGYTLKENAKRILKTYTLNTDYVLLVKNDEQNNQEHDRRGGSNREEIYLTLDAAQKFALQSRGKNASKVADFFIDTLKAVQGFHVLSMMYQNKQSTIEARASTLLSIADRKQVNYLGDIGIVNGKRMMKHGSTDNIAARNTAHKRTFHDFNLVAVYETPNNREVERRFKARRLFSDNQVNVVAKDGSVQTECFVWDDESMSVPKMMKIWKSIDDELDTMKQLEWKHEETMAELETQARKSEADAESKKAEARIAEAEARRAECELRMMELRMSQLTPAPSSPSSELTTPETPEIPNQISPSCIPHALLGEDKRQILETWLEQTVERTIHRTDVIRVADLQDAFLQASNGIVIVPRGEFTKMAKCWFTINRFRYREVTEIQLADGSKKRERHVVRGAVWKQPRPDGAAGSSGSARTEASNVTRHE